jgi:hypothetical protein
MSAPARLSRWQRAIGAGALTCIWFAALVIELATRLMMRLYINFGADLPGSTLLTIAAVQNYVPWIAVAVSTIVIVFLWKRNSAYFLHASAAIAGTAAVLASFVTLSLVLPTITCGFDWPEWPTAATQRDAPGPSAEAQARKPSRSGCTV